MPIRNLLLALAKRPTRPRTWAEIDYMEYESDALAQTAYVSYDPDAWSINGSRWTGAIATVGSGKDYATITAAQAAISADSLFLVSPGTYTEAITGDTYTRYFKAVGSYSGVIWNGLSGFFLMLNSGNIIVEGFSLSSCLMIQTYAPAGVYALSKCKFINTGTFDIKDYYNTPNEPDLTLRYVQNLAGSDGIMRGNSTGQSKAKVKIQKSYLANPLISFMTGTLLESDYVESETVNYGPDYGTDYISQGAISTELFAYSESSIRTQGNFSLKGTATTSALNHTLTRTFSTPLNLANKEYIRFTIRSNRTGANIKIGFHNSDGTTTEITPNIIAADTYQRVTLKISGISAKDSIDQVVITIVNADEENTFYIDDVKYS